MPSSSKRGRSIDSDRESKKKNKRVKPIEGLRRSKITGVGAILLLIVAHCTLLASGEEASVLMKKVSALNVLGTELQSCSTNPLTGWFRTGCCETDANDQGENLFFFPEPGALTGVVFRVACHMREFDA